MNGIIGASKIDIIKAKRKKYWKKMVALLDYRMLRKKAGVMHVIKRRMFNSQRTHGAPR
tara:strand:+ start:175 stop:351 length:177 start_codon:yes stop_codon:yes gene_type:complete